MALDTNTSSVPMLNNIKGILNEPINYNVWVYLASNEQVN